MIAECLVLILTIFFVSFILWYMAISNYRKMKVPGPKLLPILGNLLEFEPSPCGLTRSYERLNRLYGDTIKLVLGGRVSVILNKPQDVEQILKSNVNITKSDNYAFLKDWLGEGLLTSTGKKWKTRRKLITPSFHFNIIEKFLQTFDSATDILIDIFTREIGKDSTDIYPLINMYTLDIICETAMGITVNAQTGTGKNTAAYINAIKVVTETSIQRLVKPWEHSPFLFQFSPAYKEYTKSKNMMHSFTKNVIKQRRTEYKKKQTTSSEESFCGKEKIAFLDMLLQNQENNVLSDEDLREEIDTFMFEGHDTVSAGISYTLYVIAQHPAVQDKVYEEIRSFVDADGKFSYYSLQEMKYLDMVIKEAHRLYPPVPFIERKLEEGVELEDTYVPKGTIITLLPYLMGRSTSVYENPLEFNPDRFLVENKIVRNNFANVPFSAGPRNCIGQKFAMTEMKVAIAKILHRFKIESVPGHKLELGFSAVLRSYSGVCIKLKERN